MTPRTPPFRYLLATCFILLLASCAQVDRPSLEPQNTSPTQVRLYLSGASGFVATNTSQREALAQSCDLGFTGDSSPGSLLTITATGKGAKACYSSSAQHLGVFSTGEGSGKRFAVNPGETLSIGLGSDATLRSIRATSASLSVQQTTVDTLFEVQFYDGLTLVGKKQFSPTGSGTAPKVFTLSVGGKPFSRIILRPVRASFRLQGGRNVVSFALAAPSSSAVDTYVAVLSYTHRFAFNRSEPWSGWDCDGRYITGEYTKRVSENTTATATVVFDSSRLDDGIILNARSVQSGGYSYESSSVDTTPVTYGSLGRTLTAGKPELPPSSHQVWLGNDGSAGGGVSAQYPESVLYDISYSETCEGGRHENYSTPRREAPQQLAVSNGRYDQNGAFVGEIRQRSGDSTDLWTWSIRRQ